MCVLFVHLFLCGQWSVPPLFVLAFTPLFTHIAHGQIVGLKAGCRWVAKDIQCWVAFIIMWDVNRYCWHEYNRHNRDARVCDIQSAYIQLNAVLPAYSVTSVLSANVIFLPVITTGSAAVHALILVALAPQCLLHLPIYLCYCFRSHWNAMHLFMGGDFYAIHAWCTYAHPPVII